MSSKQILNMVISLFQGIARVNSGIPANQVSEIVDRFFILTLILLYYLIEILKLPLNQVSQVVESRNSSK